MKPSALCLDDENQSYKNESQQVALDGSVVKITLCGLLRKR